MLSDIFGNFGSIRWSFFPPPETNVHFRNPDKVQSYKEGDRCVGHFKCRQPYFTLYIWFHFQNPAFSKERGLQVPSKPSLMDRQSFITSVEHIGSVA